MKENDLGVLRELIRNSKQSDREISRKMGLSQPTVTRIRSRLEKTEIREYTTLPDLKSLGYQIVAVIFMTSKPSTQVTGDGRVLFASHGMGMGSSFLVISVHKNFSEYMAFVRSLENRSNSFLISVEDEVVKQSISSLASVI